MTTYQKLLRAIKTKNLYEAHELFTSVMQQKVAQRLAEVKQSVMSEDKEEETKCGRCGSDKPKGQSCGCFDNKSE